MSHSLPFVDGTTDLDATTLNQLEVKAQKAQANGYASLDAGTKVPDTQLPATVERTANKAQVNGYASLDGTGKVPPAQLPPGTGLPADTVLAAAVRIIANKLAAGDAQAVYRLLGDGTQEWGAGGSTPPDTNLFRAKADRLATDDQLVSNWLLGVTSIATDVYPVVQIDASNGIQFSPNGTTAPDTNLYRGGPNLLMTDDSLFVAGAIDGDMLQYRGDYAPGSYKDGDIVVYNGVTYMCVRPTSAAPTTWAPAGGVSSYGTTLPATPYDGQEAVLVDSVTNPSYQWRFRYNAGSSSPYKWEFIGGTEFVYSATINWSQTGAWTMLLGWPVPRAGHYLITPHLYTATTAASTIYVGIGVQNANQMQSGTLTQASGWANVVGARGLVTVPVAGNYLQTSGYQTTASQANTTTPAMAVVPARVA